MIEIAVHFRVPLAESPSWIVVGRALLADRSAQAVPLLHLLTRRELGAICKLASIHDEGPTQNVLAQLLPLCRPSPEPGGGG